VFPLRGKCLWKMEIWGNIREIYLWMWMWKHWLNKHGFRLLGKFITKFKKVKTDLLYPKFLQEEIGNPHILFGLTQMFVLMPFDSLNMVLTDTHTNKHNLRPKRGFVWHILELCPSLHIDVNLWLWLQVLFLMKLKHFMSGGGGDSGQKLLPPARLLARRASWDTQGTPRGHPGDTPRAKNGRPNSGEKGKLFSIISLSILIYLKRNSFNSHYHYTFWSIWWCTWLNENVVVK
jgi:hypothetical protein